ncbi:hypothetical protein Ahy_B02g060683 [Arachis hypogaea]|uniref:Uncharacterized protein n=1 Tax=Arachis hypogaea TaxID=3818 RepID=A0A445AJ92_ARAHY|nr:hypothetical protein Ahy_B02g060683 [Arachis hypogaea]
MADEESNVNDGFSTNDSIPIIVQQADVTSRSKGSSVNGGNNSQKPQQHSEYSRDYNVGSTSNAANSMAVYRQQVEESHHDLLNLLTQQMTTILNPMMADHKSKFEHYDEGERHDVRRNNEGFENVFQNKNNVLNRGNLHIVPHGIGFYMRRKLLNVHIPDLAHLAEKVHQTELMKKEKEKYRSEQRSKSKPFTRKEKVAYVTMESSEEELDFEAEIDLAELKKGPPYQKIKDRDVSLCPRCNAVFDAEAAAIFEKERIKKELALREEQAHQRQPIRHVEGQSSKTPQQNMVCNGFGTVRSSKIEMPSIEETHSGDIEDLLEIKFPIIVVELEDTPGAG